MQPTWIRRILVAVTILDPVKQWPCQEQVLEAQRALAKEEDVRIGWQAQLALRRE
tara:strand:- start:94 stop:258 length:165 start_codon:yes stop_codon:yes gene_type:complete